MDTESFFTPKVKKFIGIFIIAVLLTPGILLNLPPINFITRVNHDSDDSDDNSEEYSYIKNIWMTGKTSILSAIFHSALLMIIIFTIDKIY